MFISNSKFYVKSTISSTQGTGTTFNISEDFETGAHIDSDGEILSIVLKTSTQIERMTITCVGGVATIVKRGLTQADTKIEDNALRKQWTDGTIGYVTALASDLLDIDKSGGVSILSNDIEFIGEVEFKGPTKLPTFADTTERDLVYTSPENGNECFIIGTGKQVYNGGVWVTLDEGTPTPNASETVAGKSQIATDTQMDNGDDIGDTGAPLVGTPSQFQRKEFIENLDIDGLTEQTTVSGTENLIIGDKKITSVNLLRANKEVFEAGENITAGNALYIHTDGKAYKTDATNSSKINFIGFATNTEITGNNVIVDTSGVSATQTGLTVGSDYYLEGQSPIIQSSGGASADFRSYMGYSNTNYEIGQGFTLSNNSTISSIVLGLYKVGSPTFTINLEVFSDAGFTTLVGTSTNSIIVSTLTTSSTNQTFNFSGLNLNSGIYYYKVNIVSGSVSTSNYIVGNYSNINPYDGGNGYTLTNVGAVTSNATADFVFTINLATPGAISTTPGTSVVNVGKAVSTTGIQINSVLYNQNNYKTINFTRAGNGATGSVNYSHTLGKKPRLIKIDCVTGTGTAGQFALSFGSYDGVDNKCSWIQGINHFSNQSNTIVNIQNSSTQGQSAVIGTITSTNIQINWTLLAGGGWSTTLNGTITLIA